MPDYAQEFGAFGDLYAHQALDGFRIAARREGDGTDLKIVPSDDIGHCVFARFVELVDVAEGYGVRIEDTYYMDQDGRAKALTDYPYSLIIDVPVK